MKFLHPTSVIGTSSVVGAPALAIVTEGSEGSAILHKKTVRVKDPTTPTVRKLIADMYATLATTGNGIGLAAPQVGSPLRLAVIDIDGSRLTLINPRITSCSRDRMVFDEGCLSLPGEELAVERWKKITVRHEDEDGRPVKRRVNGLLAIVIQHEIDHLDGILIEDRARIRARKHR